MIESLCFLAGAGLGLGLGFVLGLLWEARRISQTDSLWERMFVAGANAQSQLGFLVKKVAADAAPLAEEAAHAAPRLKRAHNPSIIGEEHPSGPVPPKPSDYFPEDAPHAFVQRLKTTPKG